MVGDQKTLVNLERAQIQGKLDCGCQVYGSASAALFMQVRISMAKNRNNEDQVKSIRKEKRNKTERGRYTAEKSRNKEDQKRSRRQETISAETDEDS
ncbi:hypothetical protein CHS0354_032092 [Potamilus streckersoni]|uniref:Uncharacterized protein n=1 Tax=Potamilus streckersoni TaxID=2493646 RepID=A0AAE0TLK5_9BIVA|nr:hypothetical protein CHS0354_032092 [Potamilus streckersoni]